jgi:hypothetical protein
MTIEEPLKGAEMNNPPKILLCTTLGNQHWAEYAQTMVATFDQYWPAEVRLFVELDDETLGKTLLPILNKRAGAVGLFSTDERFQAFKAKYGPQGTVQQDDVSDYRKMFFRFSHKVFALADAAILAVRDKYDYLIWLDADVWTHTQIPMDKLLEWLPKAPQRVSYLGRKDWPHSECGFMAFTVGEGPTGTEFIQGFVDRFYVGGEGLKEKQQDDSWLFDQQRMEYVAGGESQYNFLNLTPTAPGMNVWLNSPFHPYMEHHKGPVAKANLQQGPGIWPLDKSPNKPLPSDAPVAQNLSDIKTVPLDIKIRNCLPHDEIRKNVSQNLALMTRWVPDCQPTDETVVMVSGGPSLDVDRVRYYARRGYRIVCVKHSLQRLISAGIVPWGCVLLDPRLHVENFVDNPDPRVTYFVASMCNPKVVEKLLGNGCKVYGYHAAVGAGEDAFVAKGTPYISYGSASAVRGLFVLKCLGFERFILLGYDLCYYAKPDLSERLPDGNKKYLEVAINTQGGNGQLETRTFWTEGQLLAQAQEIERIFNEKLLRIRAEGDGLVPWMLGHKGRYKKWYKRTYMPLAQRKYVNREIGNAGWRNRFATRFGRLIGMYPTL